VLSGQAWATIDGKGVGWVNFNSDYEVPARPNGPRYSVQIDEDGLVSGAAWAAIDGNDDYGWLSFNKEDLTNCPSGTCSAKVLAPTGIISGWARFIAPKNYSGNWDGWVNLGNNGSPDTFSSSTLIKDTGLLTGQAWGGNIVGWLAFTKPECVVNGANICTVSTIVLNQPPVVSNVQVKINQDSWCTADPYYSIIWDYSDPENDAQTSAEIKIVKSSDGSTADTALIESDHFTSFHDPLAVVGSNTGFSVSVRASDGKGGFSEWANSETTTTPNHYYPIVNFDWMPVDSVSVGSKLTFTDKTIARSDPILGILWEFLSGGATPDSSTDSPSTEATVNKLPLEANLTVTDTAGNKCEAGYIIEKSGAGTLKRRIFRER